MPLWGNQDLANNAPQWTVLSGVGSNANGYIAYGNTTVSQFVTGEIASIELITDSEMANNFSGANNAGAHTGWTLGVQGTGPVSTITISSGGGSGSGKYPQNVTGFVTFTGNSSGTGANAQFWTDYTGNVNSVVLLAGGSLYNIAPIASAKTANGNTNAAAFVVTTGGRSGRIQRETLATLQFN